MKKKHILILAFAAVVLSFVAACVKDLEEEGVYSTTEYIGTVVEKSTMQPIKGVNVQVTDGTHVHASAVTDALGKFLLKDINFDEVNKNYYLWLDGSALDLPSVQESLKGLGRKTYDYKKLVLYDKTNAALLPIVTTGDMTEIMALSAKANGNVTSDGGHNVSARGICYAKHQTPTLEDNVVTAGTGTSSFTCSLSALTKGTTYYVRTFATNSIGTVYGAQKVFTTQNGNATITTTAATSVTASSAIVGGNISADGGAAITARGICWAKTENPTTSGSHSTDGTGTGSFTHTLQQLELNTTYYYRAYATNTCGTTYGTQKSFTTTNGLPIVTINSVSGITATTAVCGGTISNNGGFSVSDKGFVWSVTQYPTLNDNHISLGSGNAPFTGSITNLSISTTYYVRAYATNSNGTSYSSQQSFTTSNGLPTVTTTNVSMSGGNVISGGNVTSDGGFPVTARGICYGVYPNPDLTSAYTHTTDGTGTGYFTSVIDTTVGRVLYARAYATNSNGTSYGNQIIINLDYLALPTFTFNGHTYRVAPDPHNVYTQYISWTDANSYCLNLTAYGYSDWRMPTIEELAVMYQNRVAIGGFFNWVGETSAYYQTFPIYHSSTSESSYAHWKIDWDNGQRTSSYDNGFDQHRLVNGYGDWADFKCHVRPIRIEN